MDEFEQSDSEKQTNYSHSTCYQNAIRYIEKENAFIQNCKCVFSLVFLVKLGGSMTEIFSVRTTEDRQLHNHVTLKYIIPLKSSQLKPIQIQLCLFSGD